MLKKTVKIEKDARIHLSRTESWWTGEEVQEILRCHLTFQTNGKDFDLKNVDETANDRPKDRRKEWTVNVVGRELKHIRQKEIVVFHGIGRFRIRTDLRVTGQLLHLDLFNCCSETAQGRVRCRTKRTRQLRCASGIRWTDETGSPTTAVSLSAPRARFRLIEVDTVMLSSEQMPKLRVRVENVAERFHRSAFESNRTGMFRIAA